MGHHFLLQGIFLTQGSNTGNLQCRQILYLLGHQGSLKFLVNGFSSEVVMLVYEAGLSFPGSSGSLVI